jgi:hypothetical protein
MSAPPTPGGKFAAPVEKVVREKRQPAVGKPGKGRPSNIGSSDADGPYLDHASTDLGRQNPAPNVLAGNEGTHDVNDEIIAEAYRSALRVGFRKKIIRKSLGFLFGEG